MDVLTMPPPQLAALIDALPAGRVLNDPDLTRSYRHDEAEWAPYGEPLAVVRPHSTAEVQTVVRLCGEHGIPVVPRGAGTGLSGGANAVDGCVVISLEAMNQVLEIDARERLAVVQPGVVNDDLRRVVAEQGLWYPPDPASAPWSTIGGNVATNAGGLCCVKYGVTGDYVLALEVVTAQGEVVRVGRRTAKGVAGYDLCSLLVGSEGTLGIVTEVTVRLRPERSPERTVIGYFDSVVDAGHGVRLVAESAVIPSALELIDRHCLEAVDAWKNMGLSVDASVVLLARTDAPGRAGADEAAALVACFEQAGATLAAASSNQEEADAMFAARRLAYPALERLGPVLTEDVCVPAAKVPEMLERIEAASRRHDTHIANIAHAGDGNLHPLLITDRDDDTARERAIAAFHEIISAAVELGGTVTGEHGIGLLKRDGLDQELGPGVVSMHHAIKDALDPLHLLNPGKAIPSRPQPLTTQGPSL